jgi:putative aldouronate transport system substrate-binding protein
MKQKRLATLLAACMVLSLMAGCGSQTTDTEETASKAESAAVVEEDTTAAAESTQETAAAPEADSAEEEASAAEPEESVYPLGEDIVLTAFAEFRYSDTGGMIETRADTYCFQYAAEVTGVRLECTDVNQQAFSETFNLMIASGDYQDLIFNVNSYYASGMDAAIDDEILVDLAPYLEEYAPNYYSLMLGNEQTMKDTHTDTGRCGQFFCLENEAQNEGSGYFIRTDMLEQTGLDAPQTLDEYHDVLLALKNTVSGIEYPLYVGSTGIGAICNIYGISGIGVGGGFGATDINYSIVDGQVIPTYLQDDYKTVLQIMNQWLNEGIYSRDYATQSTETMPPDANYYSAITNGTCAMFSYTTSITDLVNDGVANDPNFAIEPTRTMVLNAGDKIASTTAVTLVDSNGYGISTQCDQLEIAMRYLDWFYGEEGALCASYGIEDVTYYLDENGDPQWTDFVMNGTDEYTTNQIIYSYCVQSDVGNIDIHRMDWRKTDEQRAISDFWNQDVDYDAGESMSRYITMTADESVAYTAIVSDLSTYISEQVPKFVYGELNLEGDFDNFIATLKEMGIEDAAAIKQDVYDRYQAR